MNIEYTSEGMVINGEKISWDTIDGERNKIRFANSVLVRIYWDCGRQGDLEERFIIDKDEWAELRERFRGRRLYFCEPFGKHSEAYGEVTDDDITVIDNLEEIVKFNEYNGLGCGDDFRGRLYDAEYEEE